MGFGVLRASCVAANQAERDRNHEAAGAGLADADHREAGQAEQQRRQHAKRRGNRSRTGAQEGGEQQRRDAQAGEDFDDDAHFLSPRSDAIISRSSGRPRASSALRPPDANTATAERSRASVAAELRSKRNHAPFERRAISLKVRSATPSALPGTRTPARHATRARRPWRQARRRALPWHRRYRPARRPCRACSRSAHAPAPCRSACDRRGSRCAVISCFSASVRATKADAWNSPSPRK